MTASHCPDSGFKSHPVHFSTKRRVALTAQTQSVFSDYIRLRKLFRLAAERRCGRGGSGIAERSETVVAERFSFRPWQVSIVRTKCLMPLGFSRGGQFRPPPPLRSSALARRCFGGHSQARARLMPGVVLGVRAVLRSAGPPRPVTPNLPRGTAAGPGGCAAMTETAGEWRFGLRRAVLGRILGR